MKINILSGGKVRQSWILEGEKEYLKRMTPPFEVIIEELGLSEPSSMSSEELQKREAKEILKRLEKEKGYIVALDENAKTLDTPEFAKFIDGNLNSGIRKLIFLIGGPIGFHSSVKERADRSISLSRLTFPHHLARLILVEQIYRASTIIKGTGYHK